LQEHTFGQRTTFGNGLVTRLIMAGMLALSPKEAALTLLKTLERALAMPSE